jgi:hypothetical protein
VRYKTAKDDKNEKVLCSITKDKYSPTVKYVELNDKTLTTKELSSMIDDKVSIYALDKSVGEDKIAKHFAGFKSMKNFIKDTYEKTDVDFVKIAAIRWAKSNVYFGHISTHFNKNTKVENKNSPIIEAFKKLDEHEEFLGKNLSQLAPYEQFVRKIPQAEIDAWMKKHPEENISKTLEEVRKLYPLLECMGYEAERADIVEYVNAMDYVREHKKETP